MVAESRRSAAEGGQGVDRIRAAWEPYYAAAVDGKGSVRATLQNKPRR